MGTKMKKSSGGAKPRQDGDDKKKKIKKSEPAQASAGDVKFGTYIAKKHKAIQNDPDRPADDQRRTITADAVGSIENMTDHLINSLVDNAKNVMQYTKATTFSLESAHAAANLALAGTLKKTAVKAGDDAVSKYLATLPPPRSAASGGNGANGAAESAPVVGEA